MSFFMVKINIFNGLIDVFSSKYLQVGLVVEDQNICSGSSFQSFFIFRPTLAMVFSFDIDYCYFLKDVGQDFFNRQFTKVIFGRCWLDFLDDID